MGEIQGRNTKRRTRRRDGRGQGGLGRRGWTICTMDFVCGGGEQVEKISVRMNTSS